MQIEKRIEKIQIEENGKLIFKLLPIAYYSIGDRESFRTLLIIRKADMARIGITFDDLIDQSVVNLGAYYSGPGCYFQHEGFMTENKFRYAISYNGGLDV